MLPADTLTVTIEDDPTMAARTLVIRCAHAVTTLPLPTDADAAAERMATTLAVLQHYSTTTCACGRVPPHQGGAPPQP